MGEVYARHTRLERTVAVKVLASDLSSSPELKQRAWSSAAGQGKWQVSAKGGMVPRWSKDGKELYYFETSASGTLFAVPVKEAGVTLQFGAAQPLVTNWTILTGPVYDVSSEGKKILPHRIVQQVSPSLTVERTLPAA